MSRRPDSHIDASSRLAAAARTLAVDALSAEAIAALRDAGVRSILLKGPALARWLYDDGALREYDDCDLLVDPRDADLAGRTLARLGFAPLLERSDAYTSAMAPTHAECWTRGAHNEEVVDLHVCLFGAHADNESLWDELSDGTEPVVVAGVSAEVLDAPRRAVVVALHAAANGGGGRRSLEDLRRALALASEELWHEAASIAARIGALESFAAGLRLLPDGRDVAAWLGLQPPASPEVILHASSAPDGAMFLERLRSAPRGRARRRLLARGIVPPASYMRARSQLARRGPLGLVLAYVARVLTRVATAGTAVRALRTARRGA